MRLTRADYGYGGKGQNAKAEVSFPEDDGLFLLNLQTGKATLIISYAQLKGMVPEVPADGLEYINHVLFSRGGSQIFFLARATPKMNTIAFAANKDGSNVQRCFPDGWGGSHFDWLNDNELMVTAEYDAKHMPHLVYTGAKKFHAPRERFAGL